MATTSTSDIWMLSVEPHRVQTPSCIPPSSLSIYVLSGSAAPSAATAATASFSQVRTVRSVISQIRAFSTLPVRLLRRSRGIFSVRHHLQLADVLVIGKGNQTMCLTADRWQSGYRPVTMQALVSADQRKHHVGTGYAFTERGRVSQRTGFIHDSNLVPAPAQGTASIRCERAIRNKPGST